MARALAGLAASLALVIPAAAHAQTRSVSICEIAEHPTRFEGQSVRIRASLLGEPHHGWLLVESGCRRGLEFRIPDDRRDGDDPLARWNTFMWMFWPDDFPFNGFDRDNDHEIDINLELVGVIRFNTKDVDDRPGSNWAASSRVGPSRGTRQVPYIDVSTVEGARFYRLTKPRHEVYR